VKTLHLRKDDSLFVFSNRITYRVGELAEPVQFENEFYVSEITNYPEKEIVDKEYDEFCGEKSMEKYNIFKIKSPDRFYIMYLKNFQDTKH
jgi:cell fate regulator YaaT (PSP1 superfamily)